MSETKSVTVKGFFEQDNVKNKFKELLGQKSQGFITSVLQIAMSNDLLAKADPVSIYHSACVAATLGLPINQNLGFAYIVPYGGKAQFQMGYKGFIQLAQRSGQFKTISATAIYEGQLIEENPLTGYQFDFTKKPSGNPIGFAAYFELLNGFQKTLYMSVYELESHASKYSQTYKSDKSYIRDKSKWVTDFEAMSIKTVIKLLLSKFAPLSIEMQKAIITDQGIINDDNGETVTYIDREIEQAQTIEETELERGKKIIANWKTYADAEKGAKSLSSLPELFDLIEKRKEELRNV